MHTKKVQQVPAMVSLEQVASYGCSQYVRKGPAMGALSRDPSYGCQKFQKPSRSCDSSYGALSLRKCGSYGCPKCSKVASYGSLKCFKSGPATGAVSSRSQLW
jgi:hypothetical protein